MRIHMVEAGGRGGVYQHAVAVVEALARHNLDVVLQLPVRGHSVTDLFN